ncbi:GNAT family N-acetyltransferase [bacterium]|nr:GNAT family N-acetyltransferase [bacterium]
MQTVWELSACCSARDGHRNLDDSLVQEVQAGTARAWLEEQGRAYMQLGTYQLEILVHPDWRGQGWGNWLLHRALSEAPRVTSWAYGDRAETVAWLERNQFVSHRVLSKMVFQQARPEPPDWPEGWSLRTYQPQDAEPWHQLHVSLQTDPSRAWSPQRLQRQLQKTSPERFWLLFQGQRMRGYLWLKENEIFLLALCPSSRGQGIGRRLLQWAMSQSRGTWGFCDQPSTLELYTRLGFTEVGRDRCLRHCE